MRWLAAGIVLFAGVGVVPLVAQDDPSDARREPLLVRLPDTVPAPQDNPITAAKVALGKQLFFDPRLSGDNTISCASCHLPEKAFADGLARGKGSGGRELSRNTPTVLNVAWSGSLFWDGRAGTLEEQALAPIEAADEMNQDLGELEHELNAVPDYVRQFQAVFGDAVRRENIARALAAFERTLVTGPSPLDRYLAGDKNALSDEAQRGLELFTGDAGCVRCHRGPLLSDGRFYRLGVSQRDPGRSAVTGNEADRNKFRTPSLRNVAETAPYMHDGSEKTLSDVVMFYLREVPPQPAGGPPLDVEPLFGLSFSDIPPLVEFLKSLSGPPPDVTPPELP